MKKIFILALSLMLMSVMTVMALGQSLEPFFSSKPGRVLVYENLDADGNLISVNADSLAVMIGDFEEGQATVVSTIINQGDSSRFRSKVLMKFDRGEVITDMAALMEEAMQEGMRQSMDAMGGGEDADSQAAMMEILDRTTVTGECRGIPAELSVGMELPDYEIEIKVMFITSKMGCRDRKVIGRESVTTTAGTFDCYVVEEELSVKAMMMNEKSSQKSWYARGVGLVRQESRTRKKLTGTSVLTECRNLGN